MDAKKKKNIPLWSLILARVEKPAKAPWSWETKKKKKTL